MSAAAARPRPLRKASLRPLLLGGAALVVVAAMVLDTKVVRIGSADDVQSAAVFSPAQYGAAEFPKVQSNVEGRAVEAPALAKAIASDRAGAIKQFGTPTSVGAVMPVKFTGTVGEGKSGIYKVSVPDLPPEVSVRIQTGPAINGTELRDATGTIAFGNFKNQIEYQNAGAALNNAMKAAVLQPVDTSALSGKTVAVTGVFSLINPKNWLVTPVKLEVK